MVNKLIIRYALYFKVNILGYEFLIFSKYFFLNEWLCFFLSEWFLLVKKLSELEKFGDDVKFEYKLFIFINDDIFIFDFFLGFAYIN